MPYTSKESAAAYARQWDVDNREKRRGYNAAAQQRNQQRLVEYKLSNGCEQCGYNKCSTALGFHHRNPEEKEFQVSTWIRRGTSWDKLLVEIRKCMLVCANCHREIHETIANSSNGKTDDC